MTRVTSRALQTVGKGTAEKTSLQLTVRKLGGDSADVTWCDSSFQTPGGRGAAEIGKARSLTVENRVRRTIGDDNAERRRPNIATYSIFIVMLFLYIKRFLESLFFIRVSTAFYFVCAFCIFCLYFALLIIEYD